MKTGTNSRIQKQPKRVRQAAPGSPINTESGPGTAKDPITTRVLVLIGIAALTIVVHWPVLYTHALSIDDSDFFREENALVQNPSAISVLTVIREVLNPSAVTGYYQPLTLISLMMDFVTGGSESHLLPFHRTNLLLHVCNTLLIAILLHQIFQNTVIASCVSLIFSLHPITVEPIAWVSDRKTLLAAFFGLLCLNLYARFIRNSNKITYWGSWLAFLAALMSKPTVLPLPIGLVILDRWPFHRKTTIHGKIPFFILSALFTIITIISNHRRSLTSAIGTGFDPIHAPMVISYLIMHYFQKILWPVNLSSISPYPSLVTILNPIILGSMIGTIILFGLIAFSFRTTRPIANGFLFYLVMMAPMLGIFKYAAWDSAWDKYLYFPIIGLLLILAWIFQWSWRAGAQRPVILMGLTGCIGLIYAMEITSVREYYAKWKDTRTLAEYMISQAPDYAPVQNFMGSVLMDSGHVESAIIHFKQATTLDPNLADIHYNLGVAYQQQGQFPEAVDAYRQALTIQPIYINAMNNAGACLVEMGQITDAISYLNRVVQMNPRNSTGYFNLGRAWQAAGDARKAIEQYQKAIEIKPDHVPARNNIAIVTVSMGDYAGAFTQLHEILRLQPENIDAHNNIAWFLLTGPDRKPEDIDEAINHAQTAYQLTKGQSLSVLDTLGEAYTAQGEPERAIRIFQEALELARKTGDQASIQHFETRITGR